MFFASFSRGRLTDSVVLEGLLHVVVLGHQVGQHGVQLARRLVAHLLPEKVGGLKTPKSMNRGQVDYFVNFCLFKNRKKLRFSTKNCAKNRKTLAITRKICTRNRKKLAITAKMCARNRKKLAITAKICAKKLEKMAITRKICAKNNHMNQ
jgi:hypothetical protein